MKIAYAKVGLALAGVTVALLLAEISTRAAVFWTTTRSRKALAAPEAGAYPQLGKDVKLFPLIRRSEYPLLSYEFRPGADVLFHGARVRINEAGYRGRLVSHEKPAGAMRIVGLGDSVLFGWGVTDEETCLAVLESRLNAEHPQRTCQAVNLAIPGYNTAMEVEMLRRRGLAYQPDIVVLCMVGNDMELPNFIHSTPDVLSPRRSFLWEKYVARRSSHQNALAEIGLAPSPHDTTGVAQYEVDPEKVPAPYNKMVGAGAVSRALQELRALRDEHGFEVVIFPYWTAHPFMREAAEKSGLPLTDALTPLNNYLREHGLDQFPGSPLALSKTDLHPSVAGHQLIAEMLFQEIERRANSDR